MFRISTNVNFIFSFVQDQNFGISLDSFHPLISHTQPINNHCQMCHQNTFGIPSLLPPFISTCCKLPLSHTQNTLHFLPCNKFLQQQEEQLFKISLFMSLLCSEPSPAPFHSECRASCDVAPHPRLTSPPLPQVHSSHTSLFLRQPGHTPPMAYEVAAAYS